MRISREARQQTRIDLAARPSRHAAARGKVTGAHVPSPPGVPSPLLWGDEVTVREWRRDGIAHLQLTPVMRALQYPFAVPSSTEGGELTLVDFAQPPFDPNTMEWIKLAVGIAAGRGSYTNLREKAMPR
jgi:hypothetical protein